MCDWGLCVIGGLLAYDGALKVHAHFDGLAALGGCAAPDANAVLLEPGNIGEAACLNPGFGLTLSETVGPGDRSARIGRAVRRVHRRRVGIAVSRRAVRVLVRANLLWIGR